MDERYDEQTRSLSNLRGVGDDQGGALTPAVHLTSAVPTHLTPEDQPWTLRMVDEPKQMRAEMLARRGAKPYPNSWDSSTRSVRSEPVTLNRRQVAEMTKHTRHSV